ncbi:MAG: DUF4401 domain-containing protein [Planctomycetota bacterium]|nr:DUF4401 domain-containing protein [Planctomycetota bacterium]
MPPTGAALRRLAGQGKLGPDALEAALIFIGVRPGAREWRAFWQQALLVGGAVCLACAVIFFVAWNWADLHHFAKFALIEGCLAACLAAAILKGPDSRAGAVCLLGGGIVMGPLLAVYGQTYMTGAGLEEFFRAWTLLLLPLALAGQKTILFFLVWLLDYLGIVSHLAGLPDFGLPTGQLYFQFRQCAWLLAWEAAAHFWGMSRPWLAERWFPRLIFFMLVGSLTPILVSFMLGSPRPESFEFYCLYLAIMFCAWLYYSRICPDLFMPACGLFSLSALLVANFVIGHDFFREPLATALLIIILSAGAGAILLWWRRKMVKKAAAGAVETGAAPRAREQLRPSWEAVRDHLGGLGLLPAGAPLLDGEAREDEIPWFVTLFQGMAGWLASLLLLFFLGDFLRRGLDISGSGTETALLVAGWAMLVLGAVAGRGKNQFACQFGLAASLAGAASIGIALAEIVEPSAITPFAAALGAGAGFALGRTFSCRMLASLFFFACLTGGILWQYRDGSEFYPAGAVLMGCWWTVLCLGIAHGRLRESRWSLSPVRASFIAPGLYGLYAAILLFAIFAAVGENASGFAVKEIAFLFPLSVSGKTLGLAAGLGIIFFVFRLTGRFRVRPIIRAGCLAAACLATAFGWFLPWLSPGLFGLTLCRQAGDRPLAGLTWLFLFCQIAYYYYSLSESLLYKSLHLAGCGAVLLSLGLLMAKIPETPPSLHPGPEGRHA